jgi:CDP-paratose 2-epimerase
MTAPTSHAFITGGAGFIGTNLAHRLCEQGEKILILDNLSRRGSEKNISWLKTMHGDRVEFVKGDVRDESLLNFLVESAHSIFHLAAQVAVTTSLTDPISDFEVNARGTLNLLEALRKAGSKSPLIFTSTNKVLGGLDHLELLETPTRYIPADREIRTHGIGEQFGIQFCSPYGCSKGAADQYVLDYCRSFDLQAVVFRMSCIYGPHQSGNEDQGWVAHFAKQFLKSEPLTFYGNGKQVRDALYVDDLVDAFLCARENIHDLSGSAFNIGGGPRQTTSLIELVDLLENMNSDPSSDLEEVTPIFHKEWRASDQRFYVSDIRKFYKKTGWQPSIHLEEGIWRLNEWLKEDLGYDLSENELDQSWKLKAQSHATF